MTGNERDTLKETLLVVIISIVLNLSLIPFYGITGTEIATALAHFIW